MDVLKINILNSPFTIPMHRATFQSKIELGTKQGELGTKQGEMGTKQGE